MTACLPVEQTPSGEGARLRFSTEGESRPRKQLNILG
jgi:hypothetical protein